MASECTERERDREKPAVRDVVFRVGATVAIRRQLTGGWIRSFYAMVIFSCFMRERMCVCVCYDMSFALSSQCGSNFFSIFL